MVKVLNTAAEKFSKKEDEKPEAPTTKKCPFCMTEISIEATRCPHCTSQLTNGKEEAM
jgi:large conductance mechanosensitive channel